MACFVFQLSGISRRVAWVKMKSRSACKTRCMFYTGQIAHSDPLFSNMAEGHFRENGTSPFRFSQPWAPSLLHPIFQTPSQHSRRAFAEWREAIAYEKTLQQACLKFLRIFKKTSLNPLFYSKAMSFFQSSLHEGLPERRTLA